jgi:hypothetical protein
MSIGRLVYQHCGAGFPSEQRGIVFEADVDLPKVQMIRSQPMQRLVEHPQRKRPVSPASTVHPCIQGVPPTL